MIHLATPGELEKNKSWEKLESSIGFFTGINLDTSTQKKEEL